MRDFSTPPAIRFLRFIIAEHQHRMFAGNHNVRRRLVEAGYIETVFIDGQWAKLRPTAAGLAAARVEG